MNPAPHSASAPAILRGERLVLWVLWLTYGSFYFCRNNLGLAVPRITAELGYTKAELGTVLAALKLAYGVGQLVNGQLAERFPPRRLTENSQRKRPARKFTFQRHDVPLTYCLNTVK